MGHAFQLQGQAHELWLSRAGTCYRLHVGDLCLPVALDPRGLSSHRLAVGDFAETVFVAVHGDEVHVHLDGETYLLRHTHSLERFADQAVEEEQAIARAPMPGAAVALAVERDAVVRRGQALLVIESMKMEMTIAAPCDGVVQAVHVSVGQTFDRDAPLVTLDRTRAAA
ncbi:MAG TPA: biotin/lipoyl-containing protein [Methylibium sp.]|nr:biotin/lipoyl-containing protein [Methylibium sp.]